MRATNSMILPMASDQSRRSCRFASVMGTNLRVDTMHRIDHLADVSPLCVSHGDAGDMAVGATLSTATMAASSTVEFSEMGSTILAEQP